MGTSSMGERIRALRLQKGISQEELGRRIGVQKAAINKYESGLVVNLKRSTIAKLAEALECTPAYLMGWEDDKNGDGFHKGETYFDGRLVVSNVEQLDDGRLSVEFKSDDKGLTPHEITKILETYKNAADSTGLPSENIVELINQVAQIFQKQKEQ